LAARTTELAVLSIAALRDVWTDRADPNSSFANFLTLMTATHRRFPPLGLQAPRLPAANRGPGAVNCEHAPQQAEAAGEIS